MCVAARITASKPHAIFTCWAASNVPPKKKARRIWRLETSDGALTGRDTTIEKLIGALEGAGVDFPGRKRGGAGRPAAEDTQPSHRRRRARSVPELQKQVEYQVHAVARGGGPIGPAHP